MKWKDYSLEENKQNTELLHIPYFKEFIFAQTHIIYDEKDKRKWDLCTI